ncbi:hypothetical protein BDB01DRAFT_854217 [Pilobolus umbonatus]|nr:hypothetical protein BDB01DRAFT_854217 [Pilobolus umbonatus]
MFHTQSKEATVTDYTDDPLSHLEFVEFLTHIPYMDPSLKKPKKVTKIGQCEHPKHILYRQEQYLLPHAQSAPRRGRPPKGSKSIDMDTPIVELTVRPLPKRLEAVVGKANIKVCLTCLKRTDIDHEYIHSHLYIKPQHNTKRRKK